MKTASLFRSAARAVAFLALVAASLLEHGLLLICTPLRTRRRARAEWLHRWCRRYQALMGLETQLIGRIPARGLLVCNHLSYADIVVLGAAARCVFVAKKEVASWPIFGVCARLAGTLFIDRERRGDVGAVAAQMEEVLREDLLLVLFPEGTSSDGAQVLPFKTPLFEPVAQLGAPAAAAAISYELADGCAGEEVCYWGEMTLAPHLLRLFGKPEIAVTLRFGPSRVRHGDRKGIARELFDEVAGLHRGEVPVEAFAGAGAKSSLPPLTEKTAPATAG